MSTEKIKVLIVDDSVVYRTQLRSVIQEHPRFEVVAVASNGRLGLERLGQSPVDLVVLDLEMPEMDGIQTLKEMKRLGFKPKVLVFSSYSKRGAEITLEALSLGANDFVTKPDGSSAGSPQEKIRALLLPSLEALYPAERSVAPPARVREGSFPSLLWGLHKPQIVVIGSSTGGPNALESIFAGLRGPLSCPIVIAQHMPPLFTASLVERLGKLSGIPASEAKHGEELVKNHIYIAPGNYHLRLKNESGKLMAQLDQGEKINFVRPAVDPLFETAAAIYKDKCLGIILTGMGSDGKVGAEVVKNHGGVIIIQEESTCVVYGMPKAVHDSGAYDKIQSPAEIAISLKEKVSAMSMVEKKEGMC